MSLLAKFKTTQFHITIQIKGCSSLIYCKAWRYEIESVKTMSFDEDAFLISSRALMVAQVSAVNTDAKLDNLIEIMVFDGKSAAHVTIVIP